MLSEYTKNGLTVKVIKWVGGVENSHLTAEVQINDEKREDTIADEELHQVLKRASEIGFSHADGDPQKNFPARYYAEAYYELIV